MSLPTGKGTKKSGNDQALPVSQVVGKDPENTGRLTITGTL